MAADSICSIDVCVRFGPGKVSSEKEDRDLSGGPGLLASARFHRPTSGLGLGKKAQANIRSMRLLPDKMDIFTCAPHNDLLSDRKPNEAYCPAKPGKEYAVYFPDGGEVTLDVGSLKKPVTVRWLDIMKCR